MEPIGCSERPDRTEPTWSAPATALRDDVCPPTLVPGGKRHRWRNAKLVKTSPRRPTAYDPGDDRRPAWKVFLTCPRAAAACLTETRFAATSQSVGSKSGVRQGAGCASCRHWRAARKRTCRLAPQSVVGPTKRFTESRHLLRPLVHVAERTSNQRFVFHPAGAGMAGSLHPKISRAACCRPGPQSRCPEPPAR